MPSHCGRSQHQHKTAFVTDEWKWTSLLHLSETVGEFRSTKWVFKHESVYVSSQRLVPPPTEHSSTIIQRGRNEASPKYTAMLN